MSSKFRPSGDDRHVIEYAKKNQKNYEKGWDAIWGKPDCEKCQDKGWYWTTRYDVKTTMACECKEDNEDE